MITVGTFEAKTHLSKLLEKVSYGEEIIITKHGVPIARLTPVGPVKTVSVKKIIEDFEQSRAKITIGGLSIDDLKNEGRR